MRADEIVWPDSPAAGDLFTPATKITDPVEARKYFQRVVEWTLANNIDIRSDKEARDTVQFNIAYFAGYSDNETCERTRRLFSRAYLD